MYTNNKWGEKMAAPYKVNCSSQPDGNEDMNQLSPSAPGKGDSLSLKIRLQCQYNIRI